MKKKLRAYRPGDRKAEAGLTLVETMVAVLLLVVVAAGVMSVVATALTTTEKQGHLAARTAEYAQDKMEQLLALRYCDSSTNTAVFPSTPAGGTGLGSCNNPGNPALGIPVDPTVPGGTVGGLNAAAPAPGYVDYLCSDGSYAGTGNCTAANAYYIRVWQITNPAVSNGNSLKQITVLAQVRAADNQNPPQSTVTAYKAYPF